MVLATSTDRLRAAAQGKQFEIRTGTAEWTPMSTDRLMDELASSEPAAAIIVDRLEAGHQNLIKFTDEFEIRVRK